MFAVGSGGKHLEDEIRALGGEILGVEIKKFPDGEKYVRVLGSLDGEGVTVVQSTFAPPQDEHLVELILLADALREAGGPRGSARWFLTLLTPDRTG